MIIYSDSSQQVTCMPTSDESMGDLAPTSQPRELIDTGETDSTVPEVLSEADKAALLGKRWRQVFPRYNANNLHTQGMMAIEGRSYVFVEHGHPVIHLLKQNADVLGADINTQPMIDNEFYKMSRYCFDVCCNTLRANVKCVWLQ
jgi:hypothetical protein